MHVALAPLWHHSMKRTTGEVRALKFRVIYSGWCRNSRPESSGLPQLLTHQAHQDGQILHVTVSHHGRTYVGALVLESKWSVCLPNPHIMMSDRDI